MSDVSPVDGQRRYWPSLDGLRGVAVIFVVLAHTGLVLGPGGGGIGVTIFFVLSGFLITDLLLAERLRSDGISMRAFYSRRARRLLPALVAYLTVVGILVGSIYGWTQIWGASWPPILYASNFVQILGGNVGYNSHTWSLSVEEHFYLLWPWFLVGLSINSLGRRLMRVIVVFVVLRLAAGLVDTTWASWGTLTNAYALLLGGLAAVALRTTPDRVLKPPPHTAELAVGTMVLLGQWSLIDERVTSSYHVVWIPVVAAGLTAVAILDLVHRPLSPFSTRWLRYVGRVSYGWYLWHAPFMFLVPFNQTLGNRIWIAVFSFGVAAASWHVIEKPFLTRKIAMLDVADSASTQ